MKLKVLVQVHLFSLLFFSHLVLADFDCESTSITSGSCQTELKCIYDEAYEGRSSSCRCKTTITTLSFPGNTLSYDLFEKVCSQHKDKLQQLWINDAELESIDNEIFEKYSNLKYVNLAGNNIKVNFSEQAKGVVELDISSNGLSSLKPDTFSNLKFLKVLNVSFNRLEDVSFVFKDLHDLEQIYLHSNQLNTVRNNEFAHLQKLRILNLAHNFLVSFDSNLVLPDLQELYLNNNKLTAINKNDYRNLPNLRILNVAHNLIDTLRDTKSEKNSDTQDFRKNFQHTLENLTKTLQTGQQNLNQWNWFPSNGFQGSNPQKNENQNGGSFPWTANFNRNIVSNYNNLQTPSNPFLSVGSGQQVLNLPDQQNGAFLRIGSFNDPLSQRNSEENQRDEGSSRVLGTWAKLQDLNLAENRIRDIPEAFFDNLKELRTVNVSHNSLTTFDLDGLKSSSKIRIFDIRSNQVTRIDLKNFKDKWPLLKVVGVDFNLIKCEEFHDVLRYFKDNGIVLKSCNTRMGCCGIIFGGR